MKTYAKILSGAVALAAAVSFSAPAAAQNQGGNNGGGGGGGGGAVGGSSSDAAANAAAAQSRQNQYRQDRQGFRNELVTRNMLGEPGKAAESYGEAMGVADCIVGRRSDDWQSLIGGYGTEDPEYRTLGRALSGRQKSCLRGVSGTLPNMVSASLAEIALKGRGLTLEPRAMTLDMDVAEPFYAPTEGESASLDTVGRCSAVFSPGLSYAVLETEPGSDEEMAALTKLYGSTPECGLRAVPAKVPVYLQRVAIANGLYQWMELQD